MIAVLKRQEGGGVFTGFTIYADVVITLESLLPIQPVLILKHQQQH